MDILVDVSNQKLRVASNLKSLVSGTQEFVRFIFNLTQDWDDLTVFAQFKQDDTAYNQYLDEENSVFLPPEITPGTCTLTLYGTGGTVKATTNYLTLFIDKNILVEDAQSTEITQSLYDQMIANVAQLGINCEQLGARLDQIISMTEDGAITPGSVEYEVKDARIGEDGKYHDTLGSAIRGQIRELKDSVATSAEFLAEVGGEMEDDEAVQEIVSELQDVLNAAYSFQTHIDAKLPQYEKMEIYIPYKYLEDGEGNKTTVQGDCTILKCDNQLIMIDCPNIPTRIITYCQSHGLTKFTAFICSHYHADHMGGFESVVSNEHLDFSDCTFYLPATPDYEQCIDRGADQTNGMTMTGMRNRENEVKAWLAERSYTVVIPENNTTTVFNDSLSIRWLNNDPQEWGDNGYYSATVDPSGNNTQNTIINNFSLCCDIVHGSQHMLWTGDISLEAQAAIVPYIVNVPVSVFKVQHHGVNSNENSNYLKAINPKVMIIEGTGTNMYNPMINKGFTSGCEMYLENLYYKDMRFISDGYSLFPIHNTERGRMFGEKLSWVSQWASELGDDYAFTRGLAVSAEEIGCGNADNLRDYRNGVTAFYVESAETETQNSEGGDGQEGIGESISISGVRNVPDSVGYIFQIYGGGSTCVQIMYSMGANTGNIYVRSSYRDENENIHWTNWKLSSICGVQEIQSGEDLNDFTVEGTYCGGANVDNLPINTITEFRLECKALKSDGSKIEQMVYAANDSSCYYKRVYNGTSWGSWYQYGGTIVN